MSQPSRAARLSALVLLAAATAWGVEARAAIVMPEIDDRSYAQLVDELLERIPAHTPEWSDVNESDPGFSLLDFLALTDDLALSELAMEFHDRPWWAGLPIDGEPFLGELGYSLLEAALTSALPSGKTVPDDWPALYGIDTSLDFAELVARARAPVPAPATLALVATGLAAVRLAARRHPRRRSKPGDDTRPGRQGSPGPDAARPLGSTSSPSET